jgi:hypothetical protein
MPFQPLPGTDQRYALITFDNDGRERKDDPDGGTFSKTVHNSIVQSQPSHIFFFTHGWKGDVPSAVDQANRWIGAMYKLDAERAAMGASFRPAFISLHWPSQPWGEETFGGAAASFAAGASDAAIEPLIEKAVEHFGGSDDVRAPLEVIFHAFAKEPATRILPDEVVAAYKQLGTAIGFDAGGDADAAPDQEGVPLDPQAAVRAERIASAGTSFGLGTTLRNGILAGLRQASFWMMKHRARTVGEQGMHQFLAQLQSVSTAHIHLMGHSFGCIVTSSILGGPGGNTALPRPVESAALVQGALSLWSFADRIPGGDKPGYFRRVISGRAVSGPLVTTQSSHDSAVGTAYPAAVGLVNEFDFGTELPKFGGVGTWGVQGTSVAEKRTMLDTGDYGFAPGRVYNIDGSRFISGHSAIDGPEVARMHWQAVLVGRGQQV